MTHNYLSTACYHEIHGDACRNTCKFCDAPCFCTCHRNPVSGERAAVPKPWVAQARAIAVEFRDLLVGAMIQVDKLAAAEELQRRTETDPDLFWLRGEVQPDGEWHEDEG
jgi:hypothetical protein